MYKTHPIFTAIILSKNGLLYTGKYSSSLQAKQAKLVENALRPQIPS